MSASFLSHIVTAVRIEFNGFQRRGKKTTRFLTVMRHFFTLSPCCWKKKIRKRERLSSAEQYQHYSLVFHAKRLWQAQAIRAAARPDSARAAIHQHQHTGIVCAGQFDSSYWSRSDTRRVETMVGGAATVAFFHCEIQLSAQPQLTRLGPGSFSCSLRPGLKVKRSWRGAPPKQPTTIKNKKIKIIREFSRINLSFLINLM